MLLWPAASPTAALHWTPCLWRQGFRVREEAIDRIMELTEQDAQKAGGSGGIAYTVVAPSGFFKDYERIFRCSCSYLLLHAAGWRQSTRPTLHPYACLEERCTLWTVTVRV